MTDTADQGISDHRTRTNRWPIAKGEGGTPYDYARLREHAEPAPVIEYPYDFSKPGLGGVSARGEIVS